MPYLTYQEYLNLGFSEIEESEFNRLLPKASEDVDGVTRHFYKFNNLADDVPFRQEQFKKAVTAQIEYFHDMGATSSHGLEEPSTVTIGRTTLSEGSRNSNKTTQRGLISKDVFFYLKDTGLLYRGL